MFASEKPQMNRLRWTTIATLAAAGLLLGWASAIAPAAGDREKARSEQRAPTTQPFDPAAELSAGIVGSKHDFTLDGTARDLCLPCHTPHVPTAQAPRLDRRPVATQPIQPYQSLGTRLDEASLLCMSCHDGVVATDVFISAHATSFSGLASAPRQVSGLASHPVGVKYPTNDPAYQPIGTVIQDAGIPLPDGRVQCTSCHDPHNTGRHEGMLVRSNSRSRLCLSCHRI